MLRHILLLALFFLTIAPTFAHAENADWRVFSQTPVMHEGRVKPMDSFARSIHKQLAGTDKNALPWLVETLFNPANAENIPVLKILNPDVLKLLDIERRKSKLFSYKEISAAINLKKDILLSIVKTPDEDWTPAQRDLILLQKNTVLLGDLLSSLSLFIPLSIQLPDDVHASLKPYANQNLTYLDVLKFKETLQEQVKAVIRAKGEKIDKYTDTEQATTYLSFTFSSLQATGERSAIFRVIPSQDSQSWLAPWQVILQGAGTPETTKAFAHWGDLVAAYHNNDKGMIQSSTQKIRDEIHRLGGHHIRKNSLYIESIYNTVHPFTFSTVFYTIALFILILGTYFSWPRVLSFAPLFMWGGVLFHCSGIFARVYILERPPVSTLYESIIFVGLIAVLYGLIVYARNKDVFWLFLSAATGITLHLLGFSHDQDGDSLLMLSAVLNTNFWLATHVICITAGYAFCLITSVLAHYALLPIAQNSRSLFKHIHSVALVALLFSTVGTVLGGIWADQSWGRFWGWDPKENGALLIVLWLVWLLHGRVSGQMKEGFMLAGLAYLSVIVALSWFGVNLLSVGLHAYGFTDSAAWSLFTFIAVETALISGLLFFKHSIKKPQYPSALGQE